MNSKTALSKIILATGLVLITLASISNTPPSATVTGETEKTIRSYFKFPQILLPHHELKSPRTNKVEVLFTTDKNGMVNFVMAKTTDKELRTEIEKQFSLLRLNKVKQDVVHSVVLNFKGL